MSDLHQPGRPARRAVRRWTWRLFRREWRQQILIIGLLSLAVGATFVGAAAATNIPPPANAGFGSAGYQITLPGSASLSAQLATVSRHVGPEDIIENQALTFPGSVNSYDLRSQNPHGAFGTPMLELVSGRYPVGASQVAVTSGVATQFNLHVGSSWTLGATTREVVGIVENPQSLLDDFALVAPGEVTHPTQVTVLFDRNPTGLGSLQQSVQEPPPPSSGISSPATLVVLASALGLVMIGLVSIAGFTVIAQRRLRSLGMLRALGATDRHVRSIVRTNGLLVGVTSVTVGFVLGLGVWVVYRPDLERTQHHVIGLWHLPWVAVAAALALALLTPLLASRRPGRTVTRVPIVAALAGRPEPPKSITRTALPGVVVMIVSFLLMGDAARSRGASTAPLLLGFLALAAGVVLLAPTFIASLAGVKRAPLAVRLATRDLVRYRARSASTLAAISIGVLTAMVVMVATTARYANVFDYVGPNLASNQLLIDESGRNGPGANPGPSIVAKTAVERGLATSLHASSNVTLYTTSANLVHNAAGRHWNGPLFLGTPALLRAFHISASEVNPHADVLSMRPGLATTSQMLLVYGNYFGSAPKSGPSRVQDSTGCAPADCVANPVIQNVSALPPGTSGPNTVITEHAVNTLHLATSEGIAGWLLVTPQPLSTTQVAAARQAAAAADMSVESKNSLPTSGEVVDYATGAALLIALFVLAMSIGLIRAETAGDRRTMSAAGASGWTRRSITAATGGALALLGALLGAAGAYVACAAFFSNQSETGSVLSDLTQVPLLNLGFIFLGLPILAVLGGWVLAGREPRNVGRAPE
ncbi:MAG TPA: FtsX-like permease family protein [Acidimicrobiales bacterium]|nr:FtsX-like permease family protein [Acidimicrobiales bacterium]